MEERIPYKDLDSESTIRYNVSMDNMIRKFARFHNDITTFSAEHHDDGLGFPVFFVYMISLAAVVVGSCWLLSYLGLYGIEILFNIRIL